MKAKVIILTGMAFALATLSGCMEKDIFQGEKEEEKSFNIFDYSTVNQTTGLEVAYLNTGVQARVYFELYDELPVIEGKYSYTKRTDVTPLFAAYTGPDGVFKDNVCLPAYLKKVYIYTPAFYARTLIEAEVIDGNIKATDAIEEGVGTKANLTAKKNDSYMVTPENETPDPYKGARWKTWLGGYDKSNGEIGYKYGGGNLSVTDRDLYSAHTEVININKPCDEIYRSYSDLHIREDAELAVTFLGQNTCWNCSLGYYYYKDGEKPASLNKANVIMLFPNTQDGNWSVRPDLASPCAGIDRGTAVQLKYYPNIANNGDKEGETFTFPAGYRIGFVLANNAWSHRIDGYNVNKKYRAATSKGLSVDNNGNAFNAPRTAVYKIRKNDEDENIMISFEDHTDDQNFSDVVITMKSNPVKAIIDIPVVNPNDSTKTIETLKGVYAFEDMWPAQGDYDMNDVIVRHNYEKTINKDNLILSESFIFKTFQNIATYQNGLALRVHPSATLKARKYYIRKPGAEEFTEANFVYEKDGEDEIFLLTDNIKTDMGAEYKVTLEYEKPVAEESVSTLFIYRALNTSDKRWEVHLPQQRPTSKMDFSFFNTYNDSSDVENGLYYVRDGIYPFAIFLSGANEKDVAKLLDPENESKPISELYDGYIGWVESNGKDNTDWYK